MARSHVRIRTISVGVLALIGVSACSRPAGDTTIIGLVTKTETNPFFVKMKEGAQQAATAQGVTLLVGAGRSDGDNAGQVATIENQVAAGARVILVSPSDAKAIVPTISRLRSNGVLVIALDSPTDPVDATDGFFGSDNYRAGEVIGAYARARLGTTPPKIVTIDLLPGHPTGAQRHNGFLKGLALATNPRESNENASPAEVVCSGDSIGDQAKAQTVMENCLQSAPNVNVVYAINEPSAAGAYNALVKAGRDKDVFIVTVDGGCRGVADVAAGHFAATAQQYPLRMAELGVQAGVEFLRNGKKPSGFTDTGVALVASEKLTGVESLTPEEGSARCWGTK
jgi:fructose transport system substrate-binding protein